MFKKNKYMCNTCLTVSYVCLTGCLSALVYQHAITPLALPCKLLIPTTGLYSVYAFRCDSVLNFLQIKALFNKFALCDQC